MSPKSLDWSQFSSLNENSALIHAGEIRVLMADGRVQRIPINESSQARRALVTIDAAD